ncbi:50S ribosomal protein L21 [Synechococcales cyanobacterium C]|uniref:Large ribosomal subunit protein bL21 n=1 Tax=Petrachloros mirabilis ULC683 TaxID=2781853 RepID=A0A8K2A7T6_9CYAN|nr:50S ribosomal protein L21 [Petrachloros mirabilis]NCJ06290.1 50S ribosomal protein L21 [Petrachloros mirabilis ULC683]
MTYAIVEASGKQLRVEPGRFYDIDRLPQEPESSITLDRVLLVHDGEKVSIGQPYVEDVTIAATIMQHLRGSKIIVYKMQPKKKTRKKQGHRQELTRVMIDDIHIGESAAQAKVSATAEDS